MPAKKAVNLKTRGIKNLVDDYFYSAIEKLKSLWVV